jgi:hypothetical protein
MIISMALSSTQRQLGIKKRPEPGPGKAHTGEALGGAAGPVVRRSREHPMEESIAKTGTVAAGADRNKGESEAEKVAKGNGEYDRRLERFMTACRIQTKLETDAENGRGPSDAAPKIEEKAGKGGNGKNGFGLMNIAELLNSIRKIARYENSCDWKKFAEKNPELATEIRKRNKKGENRELTAEIRKLDAGVYASEWYWEEVILRREGEEGLIKAVRHAAEAADANLRPEVKNEVCGGYACLKKNGWLTKAGFYRRMQWELIRRRYGKECLITAVQMIAKKKNADTRTKLHELNGALKCLRTHKLLDEAGFPDLSAGRYSGMKQEDALKAIQKLVDDKGITNKLRLRPFDEAAYMFLLDKTLFDHIRFSAGKYDRTAQDDALKAIQKLVDDEGVGSVPRLRVIDDAAHTFLLNNGRFDSIRFYILESMGKDELIEKVKNRAAIKMVGNDLTLLQRRMRREFKVLRGKKLLKQAGFISKRIILRKMKKAEFLEHIKNLKRKRKIKTGTKLRNVNEAACREVGRRQLWDEVGLVPPRTVGPGHRGRPKKSEGTHGVLVEEAVAASDSLTSPQQIGFRDYPRELPAFFHQDRALGGCVVGTGRKRRTD